MVKILSNSDKLRVQDMTHELQILLESALPRSPNENKEEMVKATEIRDKLEAMGFKVTWEGKLNLTTLKLFVDVTLWVPKSDIQILK